MTTHILSLILWTIMSSVLNHVDVTRARQRRRYLVSVAARDLSLASALLRVRVTASRRSSIGSEC